MIWRCLAVVGIVSLSAEAAYLATLVTDRDMPITVIASRAINSPVRAGGTLRVEYTVHRARSCKTNVGRMIFDSERTRYVIGELAFPPGLPVGRESYVVPVDIPPAAKPGPALYRALVSYECNFLHRWFPIASPPRDTPFEISP